MESVMTQSKRVEAQEFRPEAAAGWDAFVWESRNGCLFHTRQFFRYHPNGRFQDCSLMFYQGSELVAVLPACRREDGGRAVLESHPGASFGGLVLRRSLPLEDTAAVIQALLDWCRDHDIKTVRLLRLLPLADRPVPADDVEYALYWQGFRQAAVELSTVLRLGRRTTEEILASFHPSARRSARKAQQSGIEVRVGSDFETFWPILEQNLRSRHDATPTHTLEEWLRLHHLFPDRLVLVGAYLANVLVAGAAVMLLNDAAAYTLYIAQDYQHQQSRPLNLVFQHLVGWCKERGFRAIDFGVSTEAFGRRANFGLFRFKGTLGGHGMRRESYEFRF